MKLTKRKGFNFFRSYFDVYNELESDKDKVAFIDALLDRQFLGIKPTELKGMAKFAYISQTNSIDSQVKGYEDKTKTRLNGQPYDSQGVKHPIKGVNETIFTPTYGGKTTPTQQVEEKEEEQEKEELTNSVCKAQTQISKEDFTEQQFLQRWKDARLKFDNKPTNISKLLPFELIDFNNIKQSYNRKQIEQAMQGMFEQSTLPTVRLRPSHFLKMNYFEQYLTCFTTKEKLFDNNKYKKPIERI